MLAANHTTCYTVARSQETVACHWWLSLIATLVVLAGVYDVAAKPPEAGYFERVRETRLRLQGTRSGDLSDYDRSIDAFTADATEVIPRIELLSPAPYWANSSAVVMKLSLWTLQGGELRKYKDHPKITFLLEPSDALFNVSAVIVLPGRSDSDPFTLISKQPRVFEITSTPEGDYSGIRIGQSQPMKVEFIPLIDRIGFEPITDESVVNIGSKVRVFLCNHYDLKTHIPPETPVTIDLYSQYENVILEEKKIDLTPDRYTQDVRYVGLRMGADTISAHGFYLRTELDGAGERRILFPWITFWFGVLGTAIGAFIKFRISTPDERLKNVLESIVCGLSICLLAIIYPVGTKLPQISAYLQPTLALVLSLVAAFFGPELFKKLLSFLPVN